MAITYSIDKTNADIGETVTISTDGLTGYGSTFWIINLKQTDYDNSINQLARKGKILLRTNTSQYPSMSETITYEHSIIKTLTPFSITPRYEYMMNSVTNDFPLSHLQANTNNDIDCDVGEAFEVSYAKNPYNQLKFLVKRFVKDKESTSNKTTSWGNPTTHTKYPSEKLVKDTLADYVQKNATSGLLKNDGTVDTTSYLTSHQDITGKEDKSNKVTSWSNPTTDTNYPSEKLVKDTLSGYIPTSKTLTPYTSLNDYKETGFYVQDGFVSAYSDRPSGASSSMYAYFSLLVEKSSINCKQIYTDYDGHKSYVRYYDGNRDSWTNWSLITPTKTSDLTNDSGFLTSHQDISGKADINHTHQEYVIDVQKLTNAETGYLSSYVVKQNGVQVGNTINIPKDFLVKSGSVKTVSTANNPVSGYKVGDKYIDLVINVQEGTATDSHIYILVSDLIDTPVAISDVTGLQSVLNDKADYDHTHSKIVTTYGEEIFSEGRDYNGEGISYGADKLIYNSYETRFYYNKNGRWDYDSGNELAVMNDLEGKEDKSNKVTSISSSSTDAQYPSAKCVYDLIGNAIQYINE